MVVYVVMKEFEQLGAYGIILKDRKILLIKKANGLAGKPKNKNSLIIKQKILTKHRLYYIIQP